MKARSLAAATLAVAALAAAPPAAAGAPPPGALDPSFNGSGLGGPRARPPLRAAGAARAAAIQPDGKIVIAGTSGGAMFVQRLTAGLAPDSSFGSGGRVTAFGGQSGVANAVAVGPGGVIAAAGTVGTDNTSFAVASFNSAGTPVFGEAL